MDLVSMWEATANNRPKYGELEGDHHCDVVIIGGGYSGLSTAYHLQEQNVQTVVLEQDRVGSGASGRNGGEVLTGYLGTMEGWAEKKGVQAAKDMWDLSIGSIDLIESIINKHNIACDFVRNGDIYAAHKLSHLEGFKREQEFMAETLNYHEIDIIEKVDLKSELNTDFYAGARLDRNSAHFHPLNYVIGLGIAAVELGAKVYEQSEALHIGNAGNGKKVVNTRNGRVFASEVVLMTNAYAGPINKRVQKAVVPIESIMISTEQLDTHILEDLIINNRAVADSKELLYYFRRTADNRMAFGGSGRSSSKRDQNHLYQALQQGMVEVFPQLKDARIEYQWSGKVGFTQSMLPYMGQLEDGTYYAFGYGGHGAAMSSMLGKLIAQSIVAGQMEANPLKLDRLKPFPFHSYHSTGIGIVKLFKTFQDRYLP